MMRKGIIVFVLGMLASGQCLQAAFLQSAWQKAQQKAQDLKQKVQDNMQSLKQKAEAQWQASQQKAEQAYDDLKKNTKILKGVPRTILQDKSPYAKSIAMVRHSGELGTAEQQLLQKRDVLIKQKIQHDLNVTVDTAPRIALCCSGGGHRAMLSTLGFTKAIRDIGVLDMTSYMVGLSGSTWLFAPWVLRDVDLDAYENLLLPKLVVDLKRNPIVPQAISFKFLQKKFHDQSLTLVDVWGAFIANAFLSDLNRGGLFSYLSNLASRAQDGKYPMPICTAVMPPSKFINDHEWFELTPFEASAVTLNASIPTWAFGRKFENGQSINFAPEQSLAFWLGTWGSAFGLSINDVIRHAIRPALPEENERFGEILNLLVDKTEYTLSTRSLGRVRLSYAKLANFLCKIPGSVLEKKKSMILVDAGIHMNLPFPPLLKPARKTDVIIACDASEGVQSLMPLRTMVDYAKTKGLKFPPIDFDKLSQDLFTQTSGGQTIAIFQDQNDPTVPTVIYVPVITDNNIIKNQYPTLKMKYSQEEAQGLIKIAYDKIMGNKQLILDTIKAKILLKTNPVK